MRVLLATYGSRRDVELTVAAKLLLDAGTTGGRS
jgi:hypothetical protein